MLAGYHHRGYLPHIKVDRATYFVTFRLADSLPQAIVARLKEQRADLLRRAADGRVESDPDFQHDLSAALCAWYAAEVDSTLDQHGGSAWLRQPSIADLVATTLRHFHGRRYALHAWCVMPNHVHAVVQPLGKHSLASVLHSWKSYSSNKANRLLNRAGQPFWQRESYDHWIRDEADLAHCIRYTEENPVKAKLCKRSTDWPWSSASQ
ncbi:MAG: transposase [Opitutaceae bacterium]|nr:transposase [Opitutaceae bacterium]